MDVMKMIMDNKTLVGIFALFFIIMITSSVTIGHLNAMADSEHQKAAKKPANFNLLMSVLGMLAIGGYLYKSQSIKQFIY